MQNKTQEEFLNQNYKSFLPYDVMFQDGSTKQRLISGVKIILFQSLMSYPVWYHWIYANWAVFEQSGKIQTKSYWAQLDTLL